MRQNIDQSIERSPNTSNQHVRSLVRSSYLLCIVLNGSFQMLQLVISELLYDLDRRECKIWVGQ